MTNPEPALLISPNRGASLEVQTVRWLRKAIAIGLWAQYLPGERELSERIGVSRPTLRLALEQLERDGLIEVRSRRRRRIVAGMVGKAAALSKKGVVGLLMPEVVLEQLPFQRDLLDVARERLAKKGFRIEPHLRAACFTGRPARALQSLTENNPVDAWLLVNAPSRVHRWFARHHISCVVSGSCEAETKLPSVDVDHGVACHHAVGVLARSGRRHIALVLPKVSQPGDVESEREFNLAVSEYPLKIKSLVVRHEETVEGLKSSLDKVLACADPPDCFLVARPPFALTTLMHLLDRGYQIPEDVALISRADDPLLSYSSLQVSCYRANARIFGRQLADELIRAAESGFGSRRSVRQLPVYMNGATV